MKKIEFKTRIYYEDTDANGIVYHSKYLNFMSRARSEYFIVMGFNPQDPLATVKPVIKHIDIEYFHPAKLYEEVVVMTEIVKKSATSIWFEHTVCDTKNKNLIYCKASVHLVFVNKNMKPCRFSL